MSLSSSPDFPSSFDPAVYLHSQLSDDAYATAALSADLLELNRHIEDVRQQKTRERVVVHHRAWNVADVFRSEEDYPIVTPSKSFGNHPTLPSSSPPPPPPTPPIMTVAAASSPIVYPATSSPPSLDSPSKRRKFSDDRNPLKEVNTNVLRGGFIDDDFDEDDDTDLGPVHKKPRLSPPASAPQQPEPGTVICVDSLFNEKQLAQTYQSDFAYAFDTAEQDSQVSAESGLGLCNQAGHRTLLKIQTCSGRGIYVGERRKKASQTYEQLVAARSEHIEGHARRSFYGVDIHRLLNDISQQAKVKTATSGETTNVLPSVEQDQEPGVSRKKQRTLLWTEKYRARKFTDLVGDERTHRSVLRWLKAWDSIVFPGSSKKKHLLSRKHNEQNDERPHKKVLLLSGPPGLGKTTLAHVCAKQAGYEVQEISASDERSKDVVKGRIRDMVGTENVRGQHLETERGKTRKAGRPVCVIVDEVDGVVGGNSGGAGEGGFIKALIDLIALDERNSRLNATQNDPSRPKKQKKGQQFRMLRPLILICNDIYHPSLRPLRQSSVAEIVHMRKPNLNMVISRVHSIFEKEGIPSDIDGVRRLCEATWGMSSNKEVGNEAGTSEGDIRSVLVVSEWVATKLRASSSSQTGPCPRLTRKWIESNILGELSHGGGSARSLGRGSVKEVVDRVFQEGAGFPRTSPITANAVQPPGDGERVVGVAEGSKRQTMERLREMIDTSGETDRILMDCFTTYPTRPIQDDTFLSKPNNAYDWLYFHDLLSSQITGSQEWELAPYMSTSILAFHDLFASSHAAVHRYGNRTKEDEDEVENMPFSGPAAPYTAAESMKANTASITSLQGSLSIPLARMYRSHADIATELLPYTLRMLAPDIKPVVINSHAAGAKSAPTASVRKASERALVARAVECMAATGVRFEKSRVETESASNKGASGGWVYRMEPPLDSLGTFETLKGQDRGVRYAVRQVLELEWRKQELKKGEETRLKKMAGHEVGVGTDAKQLDLRRAAVKKDFFGRVVRETAGTTESLDDSGGGSRTQDLAVNSTTKNRVWVSYHEGFSNAVRKPITLKELMEGL
ncbi:uncharacterized protein PV09_00555 [Verruconis gallopava]|uniref:AAA+ ATPase domain-containing protein n=1 Tax=Verruconis gallopava TaxID=253628 RepID=A0A0D2BBC4_9PEZI|nr:uncharacterized protein PV09_00555 [Verruconis gallopava]KIW08594.1 hypothetical protein PV09_00555 [Verruconis gallopava]